MNDVLVRPTEKVSRTSATSGNDESRAAVSKLFYTVDRLRFGKNLADRGGLDGVFKTGLFIYTVISTC